MKVLNSVIFFFATGFIFQFVARKIGWSVSRILYGLPLVVTVLVSVIWGAAVAMLLRAEIKALDPWLLVKIYGFGAGAYASIMNFGLLDETSIPDRAMTLHLTIKTLPLLSYILGSAYLAWVR